MTGAVVEMVRVAVPAVVPEMFTGVVEPKLSVGIRIQSNYQTNFIYFDYKGDVVENARFQELARVQPFRLLQGGQSLPINPFTYFLVGVRA